jgi:methanogenic corrinoid protein MtbC1
VDKKDIFQKLNQAIMEGDAVGISQLAKTAVEKIDPLELVNEGMTPAMKAVGEKFGCGEIYLPEMLQATEAWNEAMKILKP